MRKVILSTLIFIVLSQASFSQSAHSQASSDSISSLREQRELQQLHLEPITSTSVGTRLRIRLATQIIDLSVVDASHVTGKVIDFVYLQPSARIQRLKPWKLKYYFRESKIDPVIALKIYNEFLSRKVLTFPEDDGAGDKILVQYFSNGTLSQRKFSPTGGRLAASFYAFIDQTLNIGDSFQELVKLLSPGVYCAGVKEIITISPNRMDIPEENDWYDYEQEGYD